MSDLNGDSENVLFFCCRFLFLPSPGLSPINIYTKTRKNSRINILTEQEIFRIQIYHGYIILAKIEKHNLLTIIWRVLNTYFNLDAYI